MKEFLKDMWDMVGDKSLPRLLRVLVIISAAAMLGFIVTMSVLYLINMPVAFLLTMFGVAGLYALVAWAED